MLTFSEYAKISLDMLRIPQGLIFAYPENCYFNCILYKLRLSRPMVWRTSMNL